MKTIYPILLLVLTVSSVSAQLRPQATKAVPQSKPTNFFIDGYVAQVEEIIITDSDVRELMIPRIPAIYKHYKGTARERELKTLYDSSRDQLIERALAQKAFAESGGQIPDQYVEEEIRRVIRDRFNGDEAMLEQLLSRQKQTREEYKNMLKTAA